MEFNNGLLLIYIALYMLFMTLYSLDLLDGFILLGTLIYSVGLIILFKKEDDN